MRSNRLASCFVHVSQSALLLIFSTWPLLGSPVVGEQPTSNSTCSYGLHLQLEMTGCLVCVFWSAAIEDIKNNDLDQVP